MPPSGVFSGSKPGLYIQGLVREEQEEGITEWNEFFSILWLNRREYIRQIQGC